MLLKQKCRVAKFIFSELKAQMGFILAFWPSHETLECITVPINFMADGCLLFDDVDFHWWKLKTKRLQGVQLLPLLSSFVHPGLHLEPPVLGCLSAPASPVSHSYLRSHLSPGYPPTFWLLHFVSYCFFPNGNALSPWRKSSWTIIACKYLSFFPPNSYSTWSQSLVWYLLIVCKVCI